MKNCSKTLFFALISLLTMTLSGCAAMMVDMDALGNENVIDLCGAYGHMYTTQDQRVKIAQELNRRNTITEEEWQLILEKQIQRGMSTCALYASWGRPTKNNSSTGSWGTHIQHVYGLYSQYSTPNYVYTENGRVSSWQK